MSKVLNVLASEKIFWNCTDSHRFVTHHEISCIVQQIEARYTPIAFDERVTFGFNAPGHCLVRACLLHCMRVRLRNGYTQDYPQIMQHTHTHKAVTGCVEAKTLLSRRRQSNYSCSSENCNQCTIIDSCMV